VSAAPVARERLDAFGLDAICDELRSGTTITKLAELAGVSAGSVLTWFDVDAERSARVKDARRAAAVLWEEKAEQGIADAADPFELSKAKELAHHYRWRASKIAPREFGDKVAVGGADDLPPIKTEVDEMEMARRIAFALNKAGQ
jgi:hypothetical protein